MKKTVINFIILLALLVSNKCLFAAEFANISKKDWKIGGQFEYSVLTRRSISVSQFVFDISPEYFFVDKWAIGGQLSIESYSNNSTTAVIGPSVTNYFWSQEKLSTYFNVSMGFGLTSSTVNFIVAPKVGLDYFIIPSIAIGPSFYYKYYNSDFADYHRIGIMAAFSMFL